MQYIVKFNGTYTADFFLNAQTNNKQSKKTKFQAEKVKIVQNV